MDKDRSGDDRLSELRRRAERTIAEKRGVLVSHVPKDTKTLIHELQTHQIELEMQNEELRRSQEELEESHNKYQDLYDNSPTGYFTIQDGLIIETNLRGAQLLGIERRYLIGRRFAAYVAPEHQDTIFTHIKHAAEKKSLQTCELVFVRKDGTKFHALLETIAGEDATGKTQLKTTITDINERKRAEEELQRSLNALISANERLSIAQKASKAGIWNWDIIADKLEWSPELFHLFGLDPEKTEASFKTWGKVLHPADLKSAKEKIDTSVRERTLLNNEYRIVHPLGEVRWINAMGDTTYDENGTPLRMSGICIDITERKKIEELLRETRHYLESLFDYANAPIIVWGPDLMITRFNHAFEKLTGYDADEVIGKKLETMFPEESRKRALESIGRTTAGEQLETIEIPILQKSGKIRIALWNSANIYEKDGETIISTIAQGQDITERKRMDEIIKESEERFRTIYEKSPIGIELCDEKGRLVNANPACISIFGIQRIKDVRGFNLFSDTALSERAKKKLLRGETIRYDSTFDFDAVHKHRLYPTKKQGMIHISTNITPLQEGTSKPYGYLVQVRDITERKFTEKLLQKNAEELAKSLKEKDALLKEIHHRVKNNLQLVSSLMRLQSRAANGSTIKDIFNQSQTRIRAISLIHEKLYREGDYTTVDFGIYIADLTADILRSYQEERRDVRVHVEGRDIRLEIDSAITCGLIINELLTNSLKHAFPKRRKGNIWIIMHTRGDAINLTVSDDGVGLPKGFDISKADTLGLKLVKDMVEKHLEGRIRLYRRHGTEYRISFRHHDPRKLSTKKNDQVSEK